MRVLFVMTRAFDPYAAGVQRTTFKLGKYFTEKGLEVAYFSTKNNGNKQPKFGQLFHVIKPNDLQNEASRKRKLNDAQATQVIFHAKTGKCVIVFTHRDILKLKNPGALPRLLEAKIRNIEEFTGLPIEFDEDLKEIDLPAHLKRHT